LAFINQSKSEKQNTRKAQELYEALRSTKKSNADNCVLAVESMENYVHIYEKRDSLLIKTTKRQTLKSVLDDDKYHTLVQSHRSYLFNPNEVEKAEGNAQGLVITMSHSDCPKVLVSRSFMKNVKALL
jgi:DNA-binding LytR/AlgR family response regulator